MAAKGLAPAFGLLSKRDRWTPEVMFPGLEATGGGRGPHGPLAKQLPTTICY